MSISFKEDFFKKLEKIDKTPFLKKMSEQAGVIAVNFTKERFVQKNWIDKSRNPWKPRKTKGKGSLLVQSGRLKRSIKKLSSGKFYVFIGSTAPYAQIHNEGGTISKSVTVRSHNRGNGRRRRNHRVRSYTRRMNIKIPKRQFLGNSSLLARRIERHMYKKIKQELK